MGRSRPRGHMCPSVGTTRVLWPSSFISAVETPFKGDELWSDAGLEVATRRQSAGIVGGRAALSKTGQEESGPRESGFGGSTAPRF